MKRHVPNLLTMGSLVLGFGELGAVLSGHSELGAGLLLWALLLDGGAGQWARRRDRKTELGAELDSLGALIAFGIAVMVMAFERSLREMGPLGWVIAVGVAVAAALKLSRDNPTSPDWPRYQGLPVAACGTGIALLCTLDQPPRIVATASVALAVLMLSPLHYARFSQARGVQAAMGISVGLAALWMPLRPLVLMLVLLYALGGAWFDFWGVLEGRPEPKARRK